MEERKKREEREKEGKRGKKREKEGKRGKKKRRKKILSEGASPTHFHFKVGTRLRSIYFHS